MAVVEVKEPGLQILYYRRAAKLAQWQLAQRLGVQPHFVSGWERLSLAVPEGMVERVIEALGQTAPAPAA